MPFVNTASHPPSRCSGSRPKRERHPPSPIVTWSHSALARIVVTATTTRSGTRAGLVFPRLPRAWESVGPTTRNKSITRKKSLPFRRGIAFHIIVYSSLDSQTFNLVLHGVDLSHKITGLVGSDASSNDRSADTASSSQSHLAGDVNVWHLCVIVSVHFF